MGNNTIATTTLNEYDFSKLSSADLFTSSLGKSSQNILNTLKYEPSNPNLVQKFSLDTLGNTEKKPQYDRHGFPQIEKVIHNNPKTVVIWSDKTKTIVSCGKDAEFDEYVGFTAAVMKKIFGSNTKVKKIMKAKTVVSKKIKDIEITPQISFEETLKQTIELRETLANDENADITAIAVIDDIIELLEKEL